MKSIVTIKNLYKSFYGALALSGMDFTMNEGEIRCLIGENGCGKSTMIKIISGFYTYDSGELTINGKTYSKISTSESIAEGIQVIYQDFSLFNNMTIAENIMMYSTVAEKNQWVNWKSIKSKAVETMRKINFSMDPDTYVGELNVAQKQMVAICRAISQNAKLLVMDEPTTALTTNEVERLFTIVRELKAEGVSVLFVSHKLDEIAEICDSYTIMRNGKNVYQSESGDEPLTNEEMIYYMTGKKFNNETYQFVLKDTVPALELKNLSYKDRYSDINLCLHKGEILGITGLLGCGINDLAEGLFGLKKPDSGTIFINGKDVGLFKKVDDALKQGIAYVPEDRLTEGLHLTQSISDNSIARVVRNFANNLGILNMKKLNNQEKKGLSSMKVGGMVPSNPANSLSGGNQQKIVLIKWLASDPSILILNCPTVGVDIGAKSDIHKMVRDLASEKGVGIIIISNDFYEIMQTCNRVLIMHDGNIVKEVETKDATVDSLGAMVAAD